MGAKYPSDISPEKFELVRPLQESARKATRPCSVDLYEVFCAVLYLLRTGCQYTHLWLTACAIELHSTAVIRRYP